MTIESPRLFEGQNENIKNIYLSFEFNRQHILWGFKVLFYFWRNEARLW